LFVLLQGTKALDVRIDPVGH